MHYHDDNHNHPGFDLVAYLDGWLGVIRRLLVLWVEQLGEGGQP